MKCKLTKYFMNVINAIYSSNSKNQNIYGKEIISVVYINVHLKRDLIQILYKLCFCF